MFKLIIKKDGGRSVYEGSDKELLLQTAISAVRFCCSRVAAEDMEKALRVSGTWANPTDVSHTVRLEKL